MSQAPTTEVRPALDEYEAFCVGVNRLSGIDLAQYKRRQMERRIRAFALRRGKAVLLDYLALLATDEGELDKFLDRLTINVSQLWRNPLQWQILAEQVVPRLAQQGRIRVWSAGCSYGAEVYTLAAVCREVAPSVDLEVHGSDIDEQMIARARAAVFPESDMRTVPAESAARWFERVDTGWEVVPELRAVTDFRAENLLECAPAAAAYDLIACRNMVIYFTEESRERLYGKLARALRDDGYLMVGSTERLVDAAYHGLELVYPFIYRKL